MMPPILRIVNFLECEIPLAIDANKIWKWFKESAEIAKTKTVQKTFHIFPNGALTGVLVLSESHMAIHTWPEYKNCQLDIFTCSETPHGTAQPMAAISYLEYRLKPKFMRILPIERPVDETAPKPL